jgi:hypothetical protein
LLRVADEHDFGALPLRFGEDAFHLA